MPAKKHPVVFTDEERASLGKAARSHKRSSLERRRARILLASAEGQGDAAIAQQAGVHVNTFINTRSRFATRGTKSLHRAVQTRRKARVLDGQAEAHLVALVCAGPPAGRKSWTMNLLAGRPGEARVVDRVTGETVRQPLDQLTGMLQLNLVALTELTHVFARAMKARGGGGHVLLVGSIGGFQPTPTYAAYGATKAYVLSFGEALHAELAAHGVVVTVLSPGVTESEFFQAAGQEPTPAQKRMMMKARPVAEIGLAALFQRKSGVVAGAFNNLLTLSTRLLSRRFISRAGYRMLKP